jgi:hypothetical protein
MEKHEIERLERQYLMHSFLYYQLNESIVSDDWYDNVCRRLLAALETPEAKGTKYFEICREALDESMSGYKIKTYPPEIVTSGLRLLYNERKPADRDFEGFIAGWGYSLIK